MLKISCLVENVSENVSEKIRVFYGLKMENAGKRRGRARVYKFFEMTYVQGVDKELQQ